METTEKSYYHSLYEAAAALNSARAHEDILHTIVERVAKTVGVKGCSLMLLSPDRKLLLHTVAYGLSDWYVRKGPVSADKIISEGLGGRAVFVLDATTDERAQYREQAKKEGIASVLSVPVKLREEVIGLLRVYTARPHHFTDDEIYFAEAIANLGAIALENGRLYEASQKEYEAFRLDMLEWRAALGHEWLVEKSVVPPEEETG